MLVAAAQLAPPAVSFGSDELNPTHVWWAALTAVSLIHAVVAVVFARRHRASTPAWARFCLVAFSVGAFLRSAFPVRWSSRPHACLIETPGRVIGGDLFDRLIAQTAEVSLGTLVALGSASHLAAIGLPRTAAVTRLLAWPIVIAQCFCWVGEITDNKLFHVFEESLWGVTFALHSLIAALSLLCTACGGALSTSKPTGVATQDAAPKTSGAPIFLLLVAILSLPYVQFMFVVDIPMYYAQWQADEARKTVYDGVLSGLRRMLTCQEVADDWAGWQEDAVWETLYFGVGPLAALAIANSLRATAVPTSTSLTSTPTLLRRALAGKE